MAAFLRETATKRIDWGGLKGGHDCGLWIADWMIYWRGISDPAETIRGRYTSAKSCLALFGGVSFAVMTGRLVRRAGWRGTRSPGTGAVGVVAARTSMGAEVVGAIRTPGGWAVLRDVGFARAPDETVRVLASWEPAECHK